MCQHVFIRIWNSQSWQQSYPANSLTPNSSILIVLSCTMYLTQGHSYSLTYRQLSEEKLGNAYSRGIKFEVIIWALKQISHKYPLFYGYASFLICWGQEDLKYETILTDHLKTWFCYWADTSEKAKRKEIVWKYTIWLNIMNHKWGLNFFSNILNVKVGI